MTFLLGVKLLGIQALVLDAKSSRTRREQLASTKICDPPSARADFRQTHSRLHNDNSRCLNTALTKSRPATTACAA